MPRKPRWSRHAPQSSSPPVLNGFGLLGAQKAGALRTRRLLGVEQLEDRRMLVAEAIVKEYPGSLDRNDVDTYYVDVFTNGDDETELKIEIAPVQLQYDFSYSFLIRANNDAYAGGEWWAPNPVYFSSEETAPIISITNASPDFDYTFPPYTSPVAEMIGYGGSGGQQPPGRTIATSQISYDASLVATVAQNISANPPVAAGKTRLEYNVSPNGVPEVVLDGPNAAPFGYGRTGLVAEFSVDVNSNYSGQRIRAYGNGGGPTAYQYQRNKSWVNLPPPAEPEYYDLEGGGPSNGYFEFVPDFFTPHAIVIDPHGNVYDFTTGTLPIPKPESGRWTIKVSKTSSQMPPADANRDFSRPYTLKTTVVNSEVDFAVGSTAAQVITESRQIRIPYELIGRPNHEDAQIGLYWGDGSATPASEKIQRIGAAVWVDPAEPLYHGDHLSIPIATFASRTNRPSWATEVIVFVDPGNQIPEPNEDNNWKAINIFAPASVEIVTDVEQPQAKSVFAIQVQITNNSLVDLTFGTESRSGLVRWPADGDEALYGIDAPHVSIDPVSRPPEEYSKDITFAFGGPATLKVKALETKPTTQGLVYAKWEWFRTPGNKSWAEMVRGATNSGLFSSATTIAFGALKAIVPATAWAQFLVVHGPKSFLNGYKIRASAESLEALLSINTYPSLGLAVSARAQMPDGSYVSDEDLIEVKIPDAYLESLDRAQLFGLLAERLSMYTNVVGIASAATGGLLASIGIPTSIAITALSAGMKIYAANQFVNAKDPPNADYTSSSVSPGISLSSTTNLPQGPIEDLMLNGLDTLHLQQVISATRDRIDGALEIGDMDWALIQGGSVSTQYLKLADTQFKSALLSQIVGKGLADGINELSDEVLANAIAQLVTGTLPPELAALYTDLGLLQEITTRDAALAAQLSPSQLREVTSSLPMFGQLMAGNSVLAGLAEITTAVRPIFEQLGASLPEPKPEVIRRLDDLRLQITEELVLGRPSASLTQRIQLLLTETQKELLTSFHLGAYEEFLEFGAMAFIGALHFDYTIDGLINHLNSSETIAAMSAGLVSLLNSDLAAANSDLANGAYSAAQLKLTSFGQRLANELGSSIPADIGAALLRHSSAIRSILDRGDLGLPISASLPHSVAVADGTTAEFEVASALTATNHRLVKQSDPLYGIVTIDDHGTPALDDDTFAYTPNPGFQGVDSFSYYVIRESDWAVSELCTVNLLVGERLTAGTYHYLVGTLTNESPEKHFFFHAAPGSFGEYLNVYDYDYGDVVNWRVTGPGVDFDSTQLEEFGDFNQHFAAEGWYHLTLSRKEVATANYEFDVIVAPNVEDFAGLSGQAIAGQLDVWATSSVDAHRYRFDAIAGERFAITATAERDENWYLPNADVGIVVTDASGRNVRLTAEAGATASGQSFSFAFEAPTDGPFYVRVHSPGWNGGSYELLVEEIEVGSEATLGAPMSITLVGALGHAERVVELERGQRLEYQPTAAFTAGTQWKLVRLDGPGVGATLEDNYFLAQATIHTGRAADAATVDILEDGFYTLVFVNPLLGSERQATGSFQVDVGKYDYGDAPDLAIPSIIYANQFPTKIASDGAAHRIVAGMHLGASVDADREGLSDLTATGDDKTAQNDDDGVRVMSRLTPGGTATLEVIASAAGLLNAWIDFNSDGDWDDEGEQVFANRALTAGVNELSVSVPAGATLSDRAFARFRFGSEADLGYGGRAIDGEVEDYALAIGRADDFNFDGQVDGTDFLIWQRQLGATMTPVGGGADGNASGVVDAGDLDVWRGGFSPAMAASQLLAVVATSAADDTDAADALDAVYSGGDFTLLFAEPTKFRPIGRPRFRPR
jgi:hypothetical protein